MKKIKNALVYILFIIIALTIIGFADENKWNNGQCKCGGYWELTEIESKPDSIITEYFYRCDYCNTIINIHTPKKPIDKNPKSML